MIAHQLRNGDSIDVHDVFGLVACRIDAQCPELLCELPTFIDRFFHHLGLPVRRVHKGAELLVVGIVCAQCVTMKY